MISLTDFAHRHFKQSPLFKPHFAGTVIGDKTPAEFEGILNLEFPLCYHDGYAPFCHLLCFDNFTDARCGAVRITPENRRHLVSGYSARRTEELPVLSRWFEGVTPPLAKHIIVVVYDKEQLAKEGTQIDADWGVVAILAQEDPEPEPMTPATMMRNALGISEGGSGKQIDHQEYAKAVLFWDQHANVRL